MISLRLGKLKIMDYLRMGTTTIEKLSTDGTMAGNADNALPTEKAVKTYVDSKQFEIENPVIDDYTAIVTPDADTETFGLTGASTNLSNGDPVTFTTTNTLPNGLVAGTVYYVINTSANSFQVSATSGGDAVTISDTGTGEHSVNHNSVVIDWTGSTVQNVVLDTTINEVVFINPSVPCEVKLILTQDTTGSRLIKYWPSAIVWSGGSAPTLTTTASKSDIIFMIFDGEQYYANIIKNY
jgi:hypothetical protein